MTKRAGGVSIFGMTGRSDKPLSPYIRRRFASRDLASSLPLLRLLERRGPCSQSAAARDLSITPGACNLHCQRLEYAGLLHRVDHLRGGKGRPTIVWDIDRRRNACLVYVCDVPFLHAALTNFAGETLAEERFDLSRAADTSDVLAAIDAFAAQAQRLALREGVAIRQVVGGFPGLVDPGDGSVRQAVNLPMLDGLPFARHWEQQGLPARTVSLSLCFLFGEIAGLPPDETAAVLHWDLGVGIVCGRGDRVLSVRAAADGSSEIVEAGHLCIAPKGRRCRCGRRGCLEAYAGGAAMLVVWRGHRDARLPDLVVALCAGRADALAAARPAAKVLGRHLAWPVQWTAADRIVVTGPLATAFDALAPSLREGLAEALPPERLRALRLAASDDPGRNLRRGAFRIALRAFLDPAGADQLPRSPALML